MRIRLVWTEPAAGEENEQTFTLPITIGSSPDNHLTLGSTTVAPQHARLILADGGIQVQAASPQPLYVNGNATTQQVVQFGDVMQVGPYPLLVQPDTADLRLRLDWQDGNGMPRSAVQRAPVVIGRDATQCQIVLQDAQNRVSRRHARIDIEQGQVVLHDEQSRNGVFVNGQRIERVALGNGAQFSIGPFTLQVTLDSAERRRAAGEATIFFSDAGELLDAPPTGATPAAPLPAATPAAPLPAARGEWPPAAFAAELVSVAALHQTGIPIRTAEYAAIGGGIGSFVWVDHLRIFGVPTSAIAVVGIEQEPYARYRRLCRNSQIPEYERLRSNSESCPDNIWGWPGYMLREVADDLSHGRVSNAFRIMLQVFGEPVFNQTYTPKSGDVFRAMDREAQRIGWAQMLVPGRVRAIRKTDDERYVVAYTHPDSGPEGRGLLIAHHIQIATGYPAIKFLPHLQQYREQTGDFQTVLNAYEEHDFVYTHLRQHGGVVMLQGRGIVASRLIQRIAEERRHNPRMTILHLMRSPVAEGHRYRRTRRAVQNHIELQPFNWPRACWSGELRKVLEHASPAERKQLLDDWGGTTTADRRDWQRLTEQGLREGWYQIVFGTIDPGGIAKDQNGLLSVTVKNREQQGGVATYTVNYIIDATGLDAHADANPLLRDMIAHYSLTYNPLGRLHVENDFEILGLRNGNGRAYASGAITLGGPYAAVDSFLGLQYSAQRSVDALTQARAAGLRRVGGIGSALAWLKWAQGAQP